VTRVVSPTEFYVQLTSVEDELSTMADELCEEYDSLPSETEMQLSSVDVGSLCCARYLGTVSCSSVSNTL